MVWHVVGPRKRTDGTRMKAIYCWSFWRSIVVLVLLPVHCVLSQAPPNGTDCPLELPSVGDLKSKCEDNLNGNPYVGRWWSTTPKGETVPNCCALAYASLRDAMVVYTKRLGMLYLSDVQAAACMADFQGVLKGLALQDSANNACLNYVIKPEELQRFVTPCKFAYASVIQNESDFGLLYRACSTVDPKCSALINDLGGRLAQRENDTPRTCSIAVIAALGALDPRPERLDIIDHSWNSFSNANSTAQPVTSTPLPPAARQQTLSPPFNPDIVVVPQTENAHFSTKATLGLIGALLGAFLFALCCIFAVSFRYLRYIRFLAQQETKASHYPEYYSNAHARRRRKRMMMLRDGSFSGAPFAASDRMALSDVSSASEYGLPTLDDVPASTLTYRALQRATANFSPKRLVGSGPAGKVFMGVLPTGKVIAVKRIILSDSNMQLGIIDQEEAEMLMKVRHPNLVRLLGFLETESEHLLVSEFMPNGDMAQDLTQAGTGLSWKVRIHIAVGIARGLAFLHRWVPTPIVHGNLKATNILLDDAFNARLSDYGLSNQALSVPGQPPGPPSQASDVYSFGIILLQLFSGRRIIEPRSVPVSLLKLVTDMVASGGEVVHLVDPLLKDYPPHAMLTVFEMAYRCTRPHPRDRPDMQDVVTQLEHAEKLGKPLMSSSPLDIDMDTTLMFREHQSGSLDHIKLSGPLFSSGPYLSDSLRITSAPLDMHTFEPDSATTHTTTPSPLPPPPLERRPTRPNESSSRSQRPGSALQHSA